MKKNAKMQGYFQNEFNFMKINYINNVITSIRLHG